MPVTTKSLTINEQLHGLRLDQAIMEADIGLSRRKGKAIVDIGGCYLNKKRVRKASRLVYKGDKVRLEFDLEKLKQKPPLKPNLSESQILYQGHGIIAINKPPGMPSQATKTQAIFHVANAIETFLKEKNGYNKKVTLVHRLDQETSGVILVATNKVSANWLLESFRQRTIKKTYIALCWGKAEDNFTNHSRLTPIDQNGIVSVCDTHHPFGKSAKTKFKKIADFDTAEHAVSLVQANPFTGRSHQIRVHLQQAKLPIIGDKKYGRIPPKDLSTSLQSLAAEHHFLHAQSLTFRPGAGLDEITVDAPVPKNFELFHQKLGQ